MIQDPDNGAHLDEAPQGPNQQGKFSVNEDWLATLAGLSLVVLALLGALPKGIIH